ncbi:MAG: DUF1365 domain-containing protein [Candidatus Competibacteraceae bacterium]|nr:DUF1365 domain-containing protein [Candidatus Competibacteraceae bacterium]
MNSCLYVGQVGHRRFQPRLHAFRYRLFMLYLDLAELSTVFQGRWLWSTRRWAPARFRREDHFGDPNQPLDDCVRDYVEAQLGRRPCGPIRLLTHLRYFGYCFNPISIYYCFDAADERIDALVAEVTNMPWGERHCYVLDSAESDRHHHHFKKALHVSPFLPMALDYRWRCNEPGKSLGVHMAVLQNETTVFDATLALRHRAITGWNLATLWFAFPFMTGKVVAAIYWEALRLWRKRTPTFAHPTPVVNHPDS